MKSIKRKYQEMAESAELSASQNEQFAATDWAIGHAKRATFHEREAREYRELAAVYRAHAANCSE